MDQPAGSEFSKRIDHPHGDLAAGTQRNRSRGALTYMSGSTNSCRNSPVSGVRDRAELNASKGCAHPGYSPDRSNLRRTSTQTKHFFAVVEEKLPDVASPTFSV
jgi:hypothetical protein